MHGYEIKRYFGERSGVFWMINYGSIYPTLKSLEKDGYVVREKDEAIPVKKVYRITEKGKEEFIELLRKRTSREIHVRDEFTLHLFFLDYLGQKEIKKILNAKREGNKRLLEELRFKRELAEKFMGKYRFQALERGLMHVETELKWLNELLGSEGA